MMLYPSFGLIEPSDDGVLFYYSGFMVEVVLSTKRIRFMTSYKLVEIHLGRVYNISHYNENGDMIGTLEIISTDYPEAIELVVSEEIYFVISEFWEFYNSEYGYVS